MDLQPARLLLGTVLLVLTVSVSPGRAEKIYTNTWAVHIAGGEQEANHIAEKHGFVNLGHVSTELKCVWCVCKSWFVMYHVLPCSLGFVSVLVSLDMEYRVRLCVCVFVL